MKRTGIRSPSKCAHVRPSSESSCRASPPAPAVATSTMTLFLKRSGEMKTMKMSYTKKTHSSTAPTRTLGSRTVRRNMAHMASASRSCSAHAYGACLHA